MCLYLLDRECRFRTREAAKAAVFDYIEVFYNRQRLYSAPGYRTPAEARAKWKGSLCWWDRPEIPGIMTMG
jgi:transposase InsO family protein